MFQHTGKASLTEYGGLLSARGLLFSNRSVARQGGMRVFRKPEVFERRRAARGSAERLDNFLRGSGLFEGGGGWGRAEAATVVAPFLSR